MNILTRVTILTAGLGLALGAVAPAHAIGRYITSNGPDKCSAFTPGISNTIRNRVSGAQNVGASPIAVACVFELNEISGGSSVNVSVVNIDMRNDGVSAVNVSCSMLPGSGTFGTAVTKVVALAGSGGTGGANFAGSWDVFGIGVNCTLPTDVTIYQTLIEYTDDGTNG